MGEILTLDNFGVLIVYCIRQELYGSSTGLAFRPVTCGLLIIQTNDRKKFIICWKFHLGMVQQLTLNGVE